jgi:hypothetical protein
LDGEERVFMMPQSVPRLFSIVEDTLNTNDIVVQIDAEISRLQQAKALLAGTGTTVKRKPGRPAGVAGLPRVTRLEPTKPLAKVKAVRTLSPEARAKIAAAQRSRWAKSRKAAKSTSGKTVATRTAQPKKSVQAKKTASPKTKAPAAAAS